jgi:diguanylate cyclase (GGDEF)-like protein/PAS domain S-box-containing protein
MSRPLQVLLVEDSPADAELAAHRLDDEGFPAVWQRVDTEAAYVAALRSEPDIILSDWNLPRFSGLRALELLGELGLAIPFVILSGYIGEEAAVDAVRRGADDYVLKDRPARLGAAVGAALNKARLRDERDAVDAQLRLSAMVFDSSVEGITITDAHGNILLVNRAFIEITGYSAEEVVGANPRILQSGRQDVTFYRDLWAMLNATGRWRGELWNRHKDGQIYPVWMTISAVAGTDGVITHYVGVFTDIGDVKQAQQDRDFLAQHDALTGLPNRTLLLDRLEQALQRAAAASEMVAVLSLDLDGFGAINEAHGHAVGDALLQAVTFRLVDEIGPAATLARFGADEFVIVLEDATSATHVADIAARLQESLAMPFNIDAHEIIITATVGLSLFPADGHEPEALLRQSETAMRTARAEGQNSLGFFDPDLREDVAGRLGLIRDLRGAVARGELVVHYQPQVRLADGRLAGAEALVRWQHPEHGLIAPDLFIPLAEEIGAIDQIGAWVLGEACRQLAAWDAAGLRVPRVAVNVSAHQVDHGDLVDVVSRALRASGIGPERLELEVTESMVMRRLERSSALLRALREIGVSVSIDDFGTGHSSLTQLRHLPVHQIKIDMSFVRDIGVDQTGEAIIQATIGLAKGLGVETVAEGIELEHQGEFLRAAGCDLAQGYLYGRPVSASDFLDQVQRTEERV